MVAGDHGVAAEGVSAYPAEVTPQMVFNFLAGGAAINALARHAGADITVIDAGVAVDLEPQPGLTIAKVGYGAGNIAVGPAMSREDAVRCLEIGINAANESVDVGANLIAGGDMGIGNTTPSAAITAAITGADVATVTGRGTGVDDAGLEGKITTIRRALDVNQPDGEDGLDVLTKVGGFEIGVLAGVILGRRGSQLCRRGGRVHQRSGSPDRVASLPEHCSTIHRRAPFGGTGPQRRPAGHGTVAVIGYGDAAG